MGEALCSDDVIPTNLPRMYSEKAGEREEARLYS